MQPLADDALLRRYAEDRSDDAFAELVRRHVNLVFSVARRSVGRSSHAEEITQSVFVLLATKAPTLRHEKALSSWLFQATRLTANNFLRAETRRQRREQEAHMQATSDDTGSGEWSAVGPLVDDAVAALPEKDRQAIVLRFYEGKSLRAVGAALGASEDAADKRVQRALEKLRATFSRQGVAVGTGALVTLISSHAVQAAPLGLAAAASSAATLAGTTLLASASATAATAITMTALQKSIVLITVATSVGTGVYGLREASNLRTEVQQLRTQQAPLTAQLREYKAENDRLLAQVESAKVAQPLPNPQFKELMKLRGSSTVAQAATREVAQLKSALADQTDKVPEFMTNAFASGLATAERWKQKDAMARLDNMKATLNLTDAQIISIGEVMTNHIQLQAKKTMDLLLGKTPESNATSSGAPLNEEAEIRALLSPEQQQAYPKYLEAHRKTAAAELAKTEAVKVASDFDLSAAEHQEVREQFYKLSLKPWPGATTSSANSTPAQAAEHAAAAGIIFEEERLEAKLAVLEKFLSPEQIQIYREEHLNAIKRQAEAMKMFLPKATAVEAE